MQREEGGVSENNSEAYLQHFGFTVDDLSFLISPQSSLSPIKKKQRNVFNFENVGDEIDTSAPAPAVPGPYPANYPTVYQETYDQSAPYVKDEELNMDHDHGPIPSFEGLDLTSFENDNPEEYVQPPPSYGSNNAQCGSEASSIATEPVDIGFSRMGSSMGMGSLNFSTMSSFNFDEAEADAMLAQDALNALSSMSAQNGHYGRIPEGVADISGMWPKGSMLGTQSRANNTHMSLPPLPQMPASHMHIEDATFILNGQGQQSQEHRGLSHHPHNSSGSSNSTTNSNRASWNNQEYNQRSSSSGQANADGSTATPPLSRISSFKSTLSPLSVDMNALNAAHQAHQEARLYQQSFGANSANHSRNNSFYSTQLNSSMNHGNMSSSGRSSGASSPERNSFGSGQAVGKRTKRATEKEKERRGNRSRDDPANAAAVLLSLSGGIGGFKDTKGNTDKNDKKTDKAAEKEKDKQKEKEQKEKEDTRASKSLATISRRFVEHFGDTNTFDYISGALHVDDVHDGPPVTNRVDGAAEVLGVHVRRIYELIKILEILSLVTFTGDKRGKFGWRGTKDFLMTLGTIQAEGITKYPEVAYSHGIRLPEQPLQSPSAACGSPLTMSLPSTPVYMEGQTSPFFGASSSGKARGRHPGFESGAPEGERDRTAALALGLHTGIGYETAESIASPYDKQLNASAGTASESNAGYLTHLTSSLDMDLSTALMDPYPNSSSSPVGQLESSELTELDAFAAHMLSTDVPMELSQPEMMPKYSKKRAAVKKSSKTAATTAAESKTAGDSHEEFMVEGICKSFLQLFLVGMDGLSMNFAIQKLVPMEPNQTLHDYNKLNATKIRRVYDVANVLCSLSLINKNMIATKKAAKSEVNTPDSHTHSHGSYQSRESPLKDAITNHNHTWTSNNTNNMYTTNGGTRHSVLNHHNSNNDSSNSFHEGNASSTPGKARGEGGKGDKLLEWGSFPPTVIRDYYLNKMCI